MSKKTILGLLFGLAAGTAAAFLFKYTKQDDTMTDYDHGNENDMLDKANDYLLLARNKVEEMVKFAETESLTLIEEAGKILSRAKDNTEKIFSSAADDLAEEAAKERKEIEEFIENFRNKL